MRQVLKVICAALTLLAPACALAQTACPTAPPGQTTAALLAQFSDNAGPGTITPSNIRAVICSEQHLLSPGSAVVVLTPVSSPFNYTVPQAGMVLVSSGQVSVSRNNGTTYYQVALTGGPGLPVSAGDLVQVTWFGAGAASVPSAQFLPNGN